MNGDLNEALLTVVKKYEHNNRKIYEIDYIFDNVIKNCRDKFFHTVEYGCV